MDIVAMRLLIPVVLLLAQLPAFAHAPELQLAATLAIRWTFEPWVVACLILSIGLYAYGLTRLWKRAERGRERLKRQAASFAAGWLALAVALVSPIDALGSQLFSAHMLQHEMMMIVAAPFLVLGRPFGVWVWALAAGWRTSTGKVAHTSYVRACWRSITRPLVAWLIHAVVLWVWHAPVFFEAALHSEGIHTLQHLGFLVSALLFWWAVLGDRTFRPSRGASMLYLFTTMAHTTALGALLTWSSTPWYPSYAGTTGAAGLSPIEDLQLGGLIMWVPGGLAYVIAGLASGAKWLAYPKGA
jgi:putative membrane protein